MPDEEVAKTGDVVVGFEVEEGFGDVVYVVGVLGVAGGVRGG